MPSTTRKRPNCDFDTKGLAASDGKVKMSFLPFAFLLFF